MRSLAGAGTRGGAFWLLVLASTASHLVNSAITPIVPRITQNELGGDAALSGALVSMGALASLAAMPLSGVLADRWGARIVLLGAGALSVAGIVIPLIALDVGSLLASRLVLGAGSAAVVTALTAWTVGETPPAERGRALMLFGLGVWIGLALGPVLAENIYQAVGYRAVWVAALAIQVAGIAAAVLPPGGRRPSHRSVSDRTAPAGTEPMLRLLARPGLVGFIAWSAEGFLIAFLIPHLVGQGFAATGTFGAANVFTVRAVSVLATRLVLSNVTERFGATATARGALVALGAGLAVLAFAPDFATAAVGAALVGAGYSPLFPALVVLATDRVDPRRRSTAVGVFSAVTSAGYAAGSLLGGALVAGAGSGVTLTILAAAQVVVLFVLRRQRETHHGAPGTEPPLA